MSYLLPAQASDAANGVVELKVNRSGKFIRITGILELKNTVNAKYYVAIIYFQNNNGLYNINKNGIFSIPINLPEYSFDNDLYIVFYRSSDWTLFNGFGSKIGYPNNLTILPHNETEELGALVIKIKT